MARYGNSFSSFYDAKPMTYSYKTTFLIAICMTFFFFGSAVAQPPGTPVQVQTTIPTSPADAFNDISLQQPTLITKLAVLAGVSVLPFVIMLLTSFVKIVIVLSLLRNALGVQQSPPNQVINGIALMMTVYVMFPTGLAMYNSAKQVMAQPPSDLMSGESAVYIIEVVDAAKNPFRDFLQKNSVPKHIMSFYQMAYRVFPEPFRSSLQNTDFIVLIPAFITSQLKGAFEIGVLIYLPFFVIDLVTSNILLAMGMMMLSPLTIALPLKLLLLVMIDGWTILVQGLVMTFK